LIPREFIHQLLARIDIVDVIQARVPLRKAGREYQALCPFHNEKTPSFTVSPQKQFYHCFGCGAHGSAVGFLMQYEHLEYPEAIEVLATQVGMEVPHEGRGRPAGPDPRPWLDLLDRVAAYYRERLADPGPGAGRARAYLRQRGVSEAVAETYALGFAPDAWDRLLRDLGGEEETRRRLIETGLLVERPGTLYDRFRDRILFPIHDRRGRVVGFGGRVLGEAKPKYLNSPETPVFHKGRELYGLHQALNRRGSLTELLVVEGYMDVIALAGQGITQAVATLGTAMTPEHLRRMLRYTPRLVFCFDGDRAGRAAAWKALETALPEARDGREFHFLFLPEGEDPDSLVRREGGDGFRRRMQEARPLSEFLFDHLAGEADLESLDGKAAFAGRLRPLLERLPQGVLKEMLVARLARITGLAPGRLGVGGDRPRAVRRPPARERMTLMRRAIALLLQYPHLAAEVRGADPGWRHATGEGVVILADLLELLAREPEMTTAGLVEHWREDPRRYRILARLAACDLEGAGEAPGREWRDVLEGLAREARETELASLLQRSSGPSGLTPEERERFGELLGTRKGL